MSKSTESAPVKQHGKLRFRTRNYKHEIRFDPKDPRWVANYTDEVWEALFSQIAAHDFTGVVFYAGVHPFQYILDYKEFPEAASQPAKGRDAVRDSLRRGLAIAHRHGLTTFIQHYVSEFTKPLAEKYRIATPSGRLANVEHPVIDRYQRYCYREIFRELPDLDGLYFNFESAISAWRHVMVAAIPEFHAMKRLPIIVYRLWDFMDVEGMRKLIKTYKGRTILGHKISDTNDVYYYPCADSRVMEWKKRLGKSVEWMFLVGPCHNCGTNLCQQLWGDYDFVQAILKDAEKKGADSISFNTINEFFSSDVPESIGVFPEDERALTRFNAMHVQGVVDYFHGRHRSPAQRAAFLARRVGCNPKAGAALLQAIEASSQLILLTYQQFCYGSSYEGYRNPGRTSHLQEPFLLHPGTEFNHMPRKPEWRVHYAGPWIDKTMDTVVTPDNFLQYIIDFVDPSKPKATRHPAKLAALLKQNVDRSLAGLAQYRKLAGPRKAAELEPYVKFNAVVGDIVHREVLAAIDLYAAYFAKSQGAITAKLRSGLKQLRELQALIDGLDADTLNKKIKRVLMLNKGLSVTKDIDLLTRALAHLGKARGPEVGAAYVAYVESRRCYNEIRRFIRPQRWYGPDAMALAVTALEGASSKALEALALLKKPAHAALAHNVRAWLAFLNEEMARTTPARIVCPAEPLSQLQHLHHDTCFRSGWNFEEDFLGFFEPDDYIRRRDLSFTVAHSAKELVITVREENINMAQRDARWDQVAKDKGSLSFISRVYLDTNNSDGKPRTLIIWPRGDGISLDRVPRIAAKLDYAETPTSWQATARVPFALLDVKAPKKGEVWGLNVATSTEITGAAAYSWAPQYDSVNPRLFGKIVFA